jgi:hypothetical protein
VREVPSPVADRLAKLVAGCLVGDQHRRSIGRADAREAMGDAELLAEAHRQVAMLTDDVCKRCYLSRRLRQTLLAVMPAGTGVQ